VSRKIWHVQWESVPLREKLDSCSLDSMVAGNQDHEAYRQSYLQGDCESAGRNENERTSGSESEIPKVEPATVG
jgi:U3 small nucleolar RNA-associated protein 14